MQLKCAVVAFAGVVAVCSGWASAANVGDDFSITNGNPNGAWRYGYTPSLNAGYTLTLLTNTGTNGSLSYFSGYAGDGTPFAGKNNANVAFVSGTTNIPANSFAMHPAPNGETVVARYTVAQADQYNIAAAFSAADNVGGNVTVHVLVNGNQIFGGAFSGNTGAANYTTPASLALSAGDTVDFAVGPNGGYQFDMVALNASITVPEPTSALALSALGLAWRRRR